MADRSMVLLGTNGRVAAVTGAPDSWLGLAFDAVPGVSAEATAEARRLRERVCDPRLRLSMDRSSVTLGGAVVELVVAECVPIYRAPVAVPLLIERSLAPLRSQAESFDVDLRLDVENEVVDVCLDPEKIGWAVAQLVGNALRYVRRGTRTIPGGSIRVGLALDRARGLVVIAVEDDGPGIPPERQRWLFAREPGSSNAVGLGLSLVRDIVEAQGGTLQIRSSVGADHGTTVTLLLPYH